MARETKVGLLAGLAFIICFAVILANRGQNRPSSQSFQRYVPSAATSPHDNVGTARVADAGSSRAQRFSGHEQPSQQTPGERRRRNPSRVDRQNSHNSEAGGSEERSGRADHSVVNQIPDAAQTRRGLDTPNGTTLISQPANGGSRLRDLERRLDRLAADVASEGKATTVRIADRRSSSARSKRPTQTSSKSRASSASRYTIKSGDTLSKIAADHYGSGSTRFVNAIFEANRSTLTSPDVLHVGRELVIPKIQADRGLASERSRPKTDTKTAPPLRTEKEETPQKWYQIKKNDRYASIAREQLGDASRWPEIYELNKDKFPEPGRIREGVRIKMPARRLASPKERRP